ncbi:hypothetical protein A6C57_25830 [Fibrella sp. ES10-3-2-2]
MVCYLAPGSSKLARFALQQGNLTTDSLAGGPATNGSVWRRGVVWVRFRYVPDTDLPLR